MQLTRAYLLKLFSALVLISVLEMIPAGNLLDVGTAFAIDFTEQPDVADAPDLEFLPVAESSLAAKQIENGLPIVSAPSTKKYTKQLPQIRGSPL